LITLSGFLQSTLNSQHRIVIMKEVIRWTGKYGDVQ